MVRVFFYQDCNCLIVTIPVSPLIKFREGGRFPLRGSFSFHWIYLEIWLGGGGLRYCSKGKFCIFRLLKSHLPLLGSNCLQAAPNVSRRGLAQKNVCLYSTPTPTQIFWSQYLIGSVSIFDRCSSDRYVEWSIVSRFEESIFTFNKVKYKVNHASYKYYCNVSFAEHRTNRKGGPEAIDSGRYRHGRWRWNETGPSRLVC